MIASRSEPTKRVTHPKTGIHRCRPAAMAGRSEADSRFDKHGRRVLPADGEFGDNVLIVDQEAGPLARLSPRLRELDFRVVRVPDAMAAIERVDAFLGGLLAGAPSDLLLLVVSDHGNLEDPARQHTRNAALGLAAGPGHGELAARLGDLTAVTPAVLAGLGVGWAGASER